MRGDRVKQFRSFLETNKERSSMARAGMVRRIAKMSDVELRRVPTSVWARLGPENLVALVLLSRASARRLELELHKESASPTQKPKPPSVTRMPRPSGYRDTFKRLSWLIALGVESALIAISLAIMMPGLLMVVEDSGVLSRPSLCRQLDRWAHDCFYVVKSESITLEQAAYSLHQTDDELVRANIPWRRDEIMPRGALIWAPPRRVFDLFR